MLRQTDRLVLFSTGIPGVGKTEAAQEVQKQLVQAGIPTEFVNDYPALERWAKDNREHRDKVIWEQAEGGEFFSVQLAAYQEASLEVARSIAVETKRLLETVSVVVIESARGAGLEGLRDRYDQHLFAPFATILGTIARFANLEVTVSDHRIAMQRAAERLARDPKAAPPFVVEKYVSPQDGIQSAKQQAEAFGSLFALNTTVDNSRDSGSMQQQLDGVVGQLMALFS